MGLIFLAVLGLLSEQPRHGYDLIRDIEDRQSARGESGWSVEVLAARAEKHGLSLRDQLVEEGDTVRALEDAGAALLVLRSLYEEEVKGEQMSAFLSACRTMTLLSLSPFARAVLT